MMKTRFFRRSQKEEPPGGAAAAASSSGGMLTSSERSAMLTDSERSAAGGVVDIDIDIDFSVTESGRTVAHLVTGTGGLGGGGNNDDDVNFSITSSGRTIERIIQQQANQSAAAAASTGTANANHQSTISAPVPAAKATTSTPLVPAVTATISNPLTIPPSNAAKSSSRPIPQSSSRRHGSEDSSGSAFLSGILNAPSPNNSNNNQLSHTPPTAFGTSYENRHFGKRQRSGSVSGRLRSASDLEEKGLIDRNQKGILKDLIICGDEELQHALDQYEAGNSTMLENMIKSGALQNKAVPDLDLLGDLDLDFLTVNDMGGGADHHHLGPEDIGNRDGPGMYTLPPQTTQAQAQPTNNPQQQQRSASLPSIMQQSAPTPASSSSFASKRQASDITHNRPPTTTTSTTTGMVSPDTYDDGIGELEFTGDFSDSGADGGYYGSTTATAATATNNTTNEQQYNQRSNNNGISFSPTPSIDDKRFRSNSIFSIGDDKRLRSNSLFSALINDPKSSTNENHQELGRWMDRVPITDHNTATTTTTANLRSTDDGRLPHQETANAMSTTTATVSKPIPIPAAKPKSTTTTAFTTQPAIPATTKSTIQHHQQQQPQPKKKGPGRRKSDSAATMMDRKLKAKMKQELAEQKRREKQEKREKREREKQEKREARLAAKEEKKKLKDQKKAKAAAAAAAAGASGGHAASAMEEDEKPIHVPGSGRPRSMSDPNFFRTTRDQYGLVEIERPDGWVGAYSPESRKVRIEKFLAKRHQRVWTKTVKYDVRKNFADSRLRVKGRFVKKEDELLMRDLMSLT